MTTMTTEEFRLNFQVPKRMKYRNVPTVVNGIKFQSKREAKRYQRLLLLQKAGDVVKIELQVKYELVVNSEKICAYIADFRVTWASGNITVEDAKGFATPVYKIKRALMKAIYGITIKEI